MPRWVSDNIQKWNPKIRSTYQASREEEVKETRIPFIGGQHADVAKSFCPLLRRLHQRHGTVANEEETRCVGLACAREEEQRRYTWDGDEEDATIVRDKQKRDECNAFLRQVWCEQQAHGLTNNCYFITEVVYLCLASLGMPCRGIYGHLDRGSNSIPHAWVKLGRGEQIIDVTFYQRKLHSYPDKYWIRLKDYAEGPLPSTMKEINLFKKTHHWRYLYLCTLVEGRRYFLRCMLLYLKAQWGSSANIPDFFKVVASSCWNCGTRFAENCTPIRCGDCESGFFCDQNCLDEERKQTPTHREVCEDVHERERKGQYRLIKPAVSSMDELLQNKRVEVVETTTKLKTKKSKAEDDDPSEETPLSWVV